jgi:glycosyltransferase involved in cell wall biosynthesis
MTDRPSVSVYLPTHNRADLLAECISSVLAQTWSDYELIVVDDGSTDHTPEVLAESAALDPRVRVIRLATSQGAPHARNVAIEAMCGEYATGIDDDDLMLPWRLAQLMKAASDRWSFICSAFVLEKAGGRRRIINARARSITLNDILHRNIAGNQALVRVDRLREIGGFDEALRSSQDYDLWTRLIERYGPAFRVSGASYRMRSGYTASNITHSPARAIGADQYFAKHQPLMNSSHHKSQRLLQYIARDESISIRAWPEVMTPKTFDLLATYTLKKWFQR